MIVDLLYDYYWFLINTNVLIHTEIMKNLVMSGVREECLYYQLLFSWVL